MDGTWVWRDVGQWVEFWGGRWQDMRLEKLDEFGWGEMGESWISAELSLLVPWVKSPFEEGVDRLDGWLEVL